MSATTVTLEAVYAVDPQALVRAQRLQYALMLLRNGTRRREASGMLHAKFACSRSTAWRLVDMAADMVLADEAAKT